MCVMVGVVLKAGRLYTKTSGPLAPWHTNAMFSPVASTDAPAQSMLPSLTCVMCPPEGSAQGPSEKHRLSRSQRKIFRAVLPVPIGSPVESNTTTWALLQDEGRREDGAEEARRERRGDDSAQRNPSAATKPSHAAHGSKFRATGAHSPRGTRSTAQAVRILPERAAVTGFVPRFRPFEPHV